MSEKLLTNNIICRNISSQFIDNESEDIEKARVKSHTRKTKSGKLSQVKEYEDSRKKKQKESKYEKINKLVKIDNFSLSDKRDILYLFNEDLETKEKLLMSDLDNLKIVKGNDKFFGDHVQSGKSGLGDFLENNGMILTKVNNKWVYFSELDLKESSVKVNISAYGKISKKNLPTPKGKTAEERSNNFFLMLLEKI